MNNGYTVLARKYRPHSFEEVVGQEHVIEAMKNSLKNNKLHSVYLLSGTRGVGKTTIARIFTEAMNCDNFHLNNKPCGDCPSCISFSKGTDLDVYEIDGASKTKVEDTKELIELMQYPPMSSKYKVFIIDEVHMLSTASFNALLKTLEEPPEYAKFILCTTDPQKIPATVLSRTLHFQLKPFNEDQIKGQLIKILNKENIPYEEPAIEALARAANGSMRDCLSLTDQAIAIGNQAVLTKKVYQMIGLADDNIPLELFSALLYRSTNDVNLILDQLIKDQVEWISITQQLLDIIYQASIYYLIDPNDRKKFGISNKKLISILDSRQFNINTYLENTQLLYEIFTHSLKLYPISSNPRQVFFLSCIRALNFIKEDINSSLHNQMYEKPEPVAQYKNSSKYVTSYLKQKNELLQGLQIDNFAKGTRVKKTATEKAKPKDVKSIIQEVREEKKAKETAPLSVDNEANQALVSDIQTEIQASNISNQTKNTPSQFPQPKQEVLKEEPKSFVNDFESSGLERQRSLPTPVIEDQIDISNKVTSEEKKTLDNFDIENLPLAYDQVLEDDDTEYPDNNQNSDLKEPTSETTTQSRKKSTEISFKNSSLILADSSTNSIDDGEDNLGDFIIEEDSIKEEEVISYESLKSKQLLFTASNNEPFKEQYLMPVYSSDNTFTARMQQLLEKKLDENKDPFENLIADQALALSLEGAFRHSNVKVNPQKLMEESLHAFINTEEFKVLESYSLSKDSLRFLIGFPFKIDLANKTFYIKRFEEVSEVNKYFLEIKEKLESQGYQIEKVNTETELTTFNAIAKKVILETYQNLIQHLAEKVLNLIDPLKRSRV